MQEEMNAAIARLSQLKHLRAEADLLSARIGEVETAVQSGTARITGMPRARTRGDRVGAAAAQLADLQRLLADRRGLCLEELIRLYRYIEGIEDSLTRQVFTYRYVDGLSWQQVALRLGETDEQYPRRIHNRYLQGRLGRSAG